MRHAPRARSHEIIYGRRQDVMPRFMPPYETFHDALELWRQDACRDARYVLMRHAPLRGTRMRRACHFSAEMPCRQESLL